MLSQYPRALEAYFLLRERGHFFLYNVISWMERNYEASRDGPVGMQDDIVLY